MDTTTAPPDARKAAPVSVLGIDLGATTCCLAAVQDGLAHLWTVRQTLQEAAADDAA